MCVKRKEEDEVEGAVEEEQAAHLVEKANVSSMKLTWMEKTAEN